MSPTAHVLRSDDDGAHWTPSPLADVHVRLDAGRRSSARSIRTNHDIVYLMSLGANPPTGDRLYRSTRRRR